MILQQSNSGASMRSPTSTSVATTWRALPAATSPLGGCRAPNPKPPPTLRPPTEVVDQPKNAMSIHPHLPPLHSCHRSPTTAPLLALQCPSNTTHQINTGPSSVTTRTSQNPTTFHRRRRRHQQQWRQWSINLQTPEPRCFAQSRTYVRATHRWPKVTRTGVFTSSKNNNNMQHQVHWGDWK